MPRARLVPLLTALALAACGAPAPPAGTSSTAIDNCGQQLAFDGVPQRVVGYYQHPTELLLALGLRDKVVGMAYPDNDPLPRYAAEYRAIPQISAKDASFEQILAQSPDLVYAGYDSAFAPDTGRSREAFAQAGIATFLSSEECTDEPVVMEDVYAEVRTIGQVFQVPERAEALIAEMRASVDGVAARLADVEPVEVFVFDSGEASAYTAGGTGIGNQVIALAGGRNVFADVARDWADVSWEQVLRRAPEVIVVYDYYGTPSVQQKIDFLLGRPELADVPAIRDRRFATLTLQDTVLGVRAPFAVERLAAQLHPDRMR
ncbi:ABC transporter substrate-binding protein [Actinokineospora sp. NPDC004072]